MSEGIRLDDVTFRYPNGYLATEQVNLAVAPGERVAVVGQNGAGKTTTARLMNGLLRPTAGTVTVDGIDTRTRSAAQLAHRVGYVFQNPDEQIFCRDIATEVGYSLRRAGLGEDERRDRVNTALRLVGLEDEAETNPLDLPFSMRRFVTVAVVLAIEPDYVILDEPTAGQDPGGVTLLADLLDTLQAQGRGLVVVTHDMEFVAQHFDRVVAMADKRVVADGPPRTVFFDAEVVERARISQPVMAQVADLSSLGEQVLTRSEMVTALTRRSGNHTSRPIKEIHA